MEALCFANFGENVSFWISVKVVRTEAQWRSEIVLQELTKWTHLCDILVSCLFSLLGWPNIGIEAAVNHSKKQLVMSKTSTKGAAPFISGPIAEHFYSAHRCFYFIYWWRHGLYSCGSKSVIVQSFSEELSILSSACPCAAELVSSWWLETEEWSRESMWMGPVLVWYELTNHIACLC